MVMNLDPSQATIACDLSKCYNTPIEMSLDTTMSKKNKKKDGVTVEGLGANVGFDRERGEKTEDAVKQTLRVGSAVIIQPFIGFYSQTVQETNVEVMEVDAEINAGAD